VLLERERRIEHGFDALGAVLLDRCADLSRMCSGLFDDVSPTCEALVLNSRLFAEKSRDRARARRRARFSASLLLRARYARPGLPGNTTSNSARARGGVARGDRCSAPEDQCGIRTGQAVDRDLHHQAVGNGLELDRVIVEPGTASQCFESCQVLPPAVVHVASHAAACSRPKK
jgi:hypothetical protein